jgi:hypothetical protein
MNADKISSDRHSVATSESTIIVGGSSKSSNVRVLSGAAYAGMVRINFSYFIVQMCAACTFVS